jgi:hypothetical protein
VDVGARGVRKQGVKMHTQRLLSILAMALLTSAGPTWAQDKGTGKPPPAKQSAPSESTDAPGHDAQAGKPETGEKTKGSSDGKKSTGGKKTGTVPTTSPK